jgi:hypothetical protein
MIKWLCKLPLFKQIYRQGGVDSFPLAHKDIWETMKDDIDRQAEILAKKKLEALLNPVEWDRVIAFNPKTKSIYLGNVVADPVTMSNLQAEVQFLLESELWKILYNTPKAEAEKSMFVKGETLDDMKKGKTMLFVLDQQKKILELLKGYAQNK